MTSLLRAGNTDDIIRRGRAQDGRRLTSFHVHAPDHERSLTSLIETEIIPRLVVAHAGDTVEPVHVVHGPATICPGDIEAIVPLSLEIEADVLLAHVETILARGVPVDAVLVDLLAPAARLLGEYWEDDRSDFTDVTMALWRLQEVVQELAARRPSSRRGRQAANSALFASMPGDQHSFGTVVIDELFRREGWVTDRMTGVETPDLMRRAAGDWFDMIGLTVSLDCHIPPLGAMIAALRNVSRNPRVCIMVGGRVFMTDPALVDRVGADGTGRDARDALQLADSLVQARDREAAACS